MKSCPLRVAFAVVILWACVLSRGIVLAQVPGIINFQGKVAVSGTNMTGLGSFLFELVNGTGTSGYWSNDGRLPPASPVQLPVTNGMFSVMLGDTNVTGMTAIPFTVFTNSDVRLRVWFGAATNTIQQMSTDQRIAAVGYAMVAASLVGGYVDLASPQTITGAKLFATNLLVQQGVTPRYCGVWVSRTTRTPTWV